MNRLLYIFLTLACAGLHNQVFGCSKQLQSELKPYIVIDREKDGIEGAAYFPKVIDNASFSQATLQIMRPNFEVDLAFAAKTIPAETIDETEESSDFQAVGFYATEELFSKLVLFVQYRWPKIEREDGSFSIVMCGPTRQYKLSKLEVKNA